MKSRLYSRSLHPLVGLTEPIFAGLAGRKAHREQKHPHRPKGTVENRHELKEVRRGSVGDKSEAVSQLGGHEPRHRSVSESGGSAGLATSRYIFHPSSILRNRTRPVCRSVRGSLAPAGV